MCKNWLLLSLWVYNTQYQLQCDIECDYRYIIYMVLSNSAWKVIFLIQFCICRCTRLNTIFNSRPRLFLLFKTYIITLNRLRINCLLFSTIIRYYVFSHCAFAMTPFFFWILGLTSVFIRGVYSLCEYKVDIVVTCNFW